MRALMVAWPTRLVRAASVHWPPEAGPRGAQPWSGATAFSTTTGRFRRCSRLGSALRARRQLCSRHCGLHAAVGRADEELQRPLRHVTV